MSLKAEWDQRLLPSAYRLTAAERAKLLTRLCRAVGSYAVGELSIAYVSPLVMRRLNRTYRKKDQQTDVLSFRLDPMLGEVLICFAQAKRQAVLHHWSVKTELKNLVIHGILHTFGFDHTTVKEAGVMLPLQEKILNRLC